MMFFFNVLFWLTIVALVVIGGLGELLYGDYKNITQTGFTSATAILMGVGCVIGVLGFAGCYGAIRENYYTLKVFSYLLTLLLIAEIALGLWLYFAHFNLAKFLKDFLDNILSKYEEDKDIQHLIDKIQREYHCCGSKATKTGLTRSGTTNVRKTARRIGSTVSRDPAVFPTPRICRVAETIWTPLTNQPRGLSIQKAVCFARSSSRSISRL